MNDLHTEVEIKPQLKLRGSVAKEEDPKSSHQLYKLQIKSTQLSRPCVYGIYKMPLRAPTKENAVTLIAVDTGGKNTQELDQIRICTAPTAGPEISSVLEGILGR